MATKVQIAAITILAIMVLSTIGFSIVSFYADKEIEQSEKEIKYCTNSSDCILICGMEPYFVNCTKNICEETECPWLNNSSLEIERYKLMDFYEVKTGEVLI